MRVILFCLILSLPLAAQFPNIKLNKLNTEPEEMTIAINPVNPQQLAAGANIDQYFYSSDGGYSWTYKKLTSQYGVWGDPCVLFDSMGNLYFAHLSNPPAGHWIDRIVVQRSSDFGQSWTADVGVGLNGAKQQDKEWLATDLTNSPFKNNIYMAWTEFDSYGSHAPDDSTRIRFSRSENSGESWSAPIIISDRSGNCLDDDETVEGAVPAVGPEGQVYISWSGPDGIVFDKSCDGGQSFGKDVFVTDQPGGWAFTIPGISRCNGMPVTLCDISASEYRGTVYIMWSDQRNGPDDTDIFISKSLDEGETWSSPLRVNDDQGPAQQFFPWATVDPVSGYIYIVFYDRRQQTGNATDVYLARSVDGAETFENILISESPFIPQANVFFGDYTNIAARAGKVYPIWMRMDNWELSAMVALIEEPLSLEGDGAINPRFYLYQNYPNPFNPKTVISYQLAVGSEVDLSIHNILGQKVAVLVSGWQKAEKYSVDFDAAGLPSGIYFCKLEAGGYRSVKQMLFVK